MAMQWPASDAAARGSVRRRCLRVFACSILLLAGSQGDAARRGSRLLTLRTDKRAESLVLRKNKCR